MAAYALTQAGANVVMLEAGEWWDNAKDSAMLRRGLVVWRGSVVGKRLGRTQGIPAVEPDDVLQRMSE